MNKTSSAIVRTLLLGTSCLSVLAVLPAKADPAGGVVVGGSATITTNGSSTIINQKTNKAVIDWDSFSVSAGGVVRFNQPGSSSFTLNRVVGSAPSTIYGSILANGNVWLINGNGVMFGKGSTINVGGLIATTADIANNDFMNGNYSFGNGTGAAIVNQGTIRTRSRGTVVLSGASVSNQGLIEANAGTVVLGGASAFTVDFGGDGLLRYQVAQATGPADNGQTGVSNSGTIRATGGHVLMTARAAASVQDAVVNNTGMISATSAKVQNGEVILDGSDGDVNVGGTVDASGAGAGQTGGAFTAVGRNVTVADNAKIDVSGDSGGGTVRIGGDLHGGTALPQSDNVSIGSATIKADATRKGNGGTVVVWSKGRTAVAGIISAKGGAQGGNGGQVETSGHTLAVADSARVDTSAPRGQTGDWLLDPAAIVISAGEGSGTAIPPDGTLPVDTDSDSTDYVHPDAIVTALASTNVTLEASQYIEVDAPVTYTSGNALSLLSEGDINVYASIQNAGTGAITLAAGWDGHTVDPLALTQAGAYGNGGTIAVGGENAESSVSVGSQGGLLTVLTGDLDITAVNGAAQLGYAAGGGMGAITVQATGDLTLTASTNGDCGGCSAQIGNGGVEVSGDNGGDITVNAEGDVTLTAGAEAYSFVQIGNGGDSSTGNDSGAVSVIAGGSLTINGSNDYAQIGNGGWGVSGDSSGKVTVQAGGDIVLTGDSEGDFGSIQIGNGGQEATGSFSGDVSVTAGGDLTMIGGGNADFVQIGNGAADGTAGDGSSTGNATGDISVNVTGVATFDSGSGGAVWVGNVASSDGTQSGNVVLVADGIGGESDLGANLVADLAGGDFTLGVTGDELDVPELDYDSAHTLNLLSSGNLVFSNSVQNSGSGGINLVAGWDGTTLDPAHFGDDGVYGNNYGVVAIGGPDADGDVAVGSAGGALNIYGSALDVEAYWGNVQVGYHGAGGGDINVNVGDYVYLSAQDDEDGVYSVQLGNGTLDGDAGGQVTGNINVNAGGAITLDVYTGEGCDCDNVPAQQSGLHQDAATNPGSLNQDVNDSFLVRIGNAGGEDDPAPTGDVTVVGDTIDDEDNGTLGTSIAADLGYGNVTIGQRSDESPLRIDTDVGYDSDYTLSLLSGGDIQINGSVQNSGTGGINLVAGWDGTTTDAAHFGDDGVYGNNDGTVTVGGDNAIGDASIGTAGGTLSIYAASLDLSPEYGNVQVGYHGAGSGAINVKVTGDINAFGNGEEDYSVQLGNGTLGDDVEGDVSGNIDLRAGGQIVFVSGEGQSWLGNHAIAGYKASGTVTAVSTGGSYDSDYLAYDLGTSADTGGMVFIGFNGDPATPGFRLGGLDYNSPHEFVFATTMSDSVIGSVLNHGTGDVTLVAGWDGTTIGGGAAILAAHAYGLNGTVLNIGGDHPFEEGDQTFDLNQYEDVAVGSAGGTTYVLGGTVNVAPAEGYYAQIGYHGTGGGNIVVRATGDLNVTGGGTAHDYAMIGNGSPLGDVEGDITGNIDVLVSGTTTLNGSEGTSLAWIGNIAGDGSTETGNVLIVTGDIDGDHAFNGNIVSDLGGGDVTVALTDPGGPTLIDGTALLYNSSHTLNLLSTGSFTIASSIQNSGSGDIDIVAGWDGTTLDAAHFVDTGVFGNNNGGITLGGADIGSIAVGSAEGTTHVAGATVALDALGGSVQLGYDGATGGAIFVDALDAVTLTGGEGVGHIAQIGNGATFGSNSAGGDVTISAGSIVTSPNGEVTADDLILSTATGDIGAVADGLKIAANTLQVTTAGGGAYLNSPGMGVVIGGTGVNTAGGAFLLVADGAIGQTAAIHTGTLTVTTLTGAITLTDTGNLFGALDVTTHGSDNAAFRHDGVLTVQSANVGGTLSLTAGQINEGSGAIVAAGLDISVVGLSGDGSVVLANSGNSFGALTIQNAATATIVDSSAVALGPSTITGGFSLTAGGAITQTGVLSSGAFTVATTSGSITLTNSENSFGALTVTTHGSDGASLTNHGAIQVTGAQVGGTLTLNAGNGITQTGAIVAGGLSASTTAGNIVLTNAGNSFAALAVSTGSAGDANVTDAGAVALGASTVGGAFTLGAGGAITETGALSVTNSLTVSTTTGSIALTNAGNSFGALNVTTHGSDGAAFTSQGAIQVASAQVGGTLTLNAGNGITETAAIAAGGLAASTASGAIALTNTGNAIGGTVTLSAPGAVTFYDTLTTTLGASSAGGDLAVLSKDNVNVIGSVQSATSNIFVVAGWDGTTTATSAFGNSGVYGNNGGSITIGGANAAGTVVFGSQSGATALFASAVTISGTHGGAQLGYHGTGGGAITVRALHDLTLDGVAYNAMIGNGSLGTDVTGAVTGDIDLRVGGNLVANAGTPSSQGWIGNSSHGGGETGNVILVLTDATGSQEHALSAFAAADIVGGDVTLGFTGTGDQGPDQPIAYSSSHTLNVLTVGNFVAYASVQNAGTGAINVVAGWDGHTLSPSSFGTTGVYGNNGKGVAIGGTDAVGNVALGSAGGTTSIYGASLTLAASQGYAQLGYNGHGTGAISVLTTGAVTLTGGGSAGQFAQIGNGGLNTSGSNNGDIDITAGGDVTLTGGAGTEAYAQIGHGGAESNSNSEGYGNVAPITVSAADIVLGGGSGQAAYAQIGNGGYKVGQNITGGTATNSGDVTVTAAHNVSLTGNGADAYAQIGNGGSQSNLNPAASAGGTDSGIISVLAPNGPGGSVTLTGGAGANAYAQVGNGGYAVNSGPASTVASWTVTGNITVTDLALQGGGPNGYGVIGNGDASQHSYGNISGDIVIDANGQITYQNGPGGTSAPGTIGNFTGQGTVSGTITGATPPSDIASDPGVIGVAVNNTANDGSPTDNVPIINTVVITNTDENKDDTHSAVTVETQTPGPLASLDQSGADSSTPNTADSATVVIANSLDGARQAGAQTLLSGMLKQMPSGEGSVHPIPPADQDFSSWGNEALWQ